MITTGAAQWHAAAGHHRAESADPGSERPRPVPWSGPAVASGHHPAGHPRQQQPAASGHHRPAPQHLHGHGQCRVGHPRVYPTQQPDLCATHMVLHHPDLSALAVAEKLESSSRNLHADVSALAAVDETRFQSRCFKIITIIIIVIIIVLKGAIWDLYKSHWATSCLQHVRSSGQGAIVCNTSGTYHVQHVMCHMVWRDNSAIMFDRVSITFLLASFYWLNHVPLKEGRTRECPEKTPDDELQKCHILKPENSSPNRDSNPLSSIDGLLGKQIYANHYTTCHPKFPVVAAREKMLSSPRFF